MYSIYALLDPRNGVTRYVGMSKDVYNRFATHILDRENKAKVAWISELKQAKMLPVLAILEDSIPDRDRARVCEEVWITKLKAEGALLTNIQMPLYVHSPSGQRVCIDRQYPLQLTSNPSSPLRSGVTEVKAYELARKIASSMKCHLALKTQKPFIPDAVYCLQHPQQGHHFIYVMMYDDLLTSSEQELRLCLQEILQDVAL